MSVLCRASVARFPRYAYQREVGPSGRCLPFELISGSWFAAAKEAGLYQEAIELANRSPCDPKTLIRAARDTMETQPQFAVEAGIAALRWLVAGHGYEITALDVWAAYDHCMKAAGFAGCREEAIARVRGIVGQDRLPDRFVLKILGPVLGLDLRGEPV